MKKIYSLLISFTFLLGACDYLDFEETDKLNTKENIYKYFDSTKKMLTHVYSFIPQDFGAVGGAMRNTVTFQLQYKVLQVIHGRLISR